MPLTTSVPSSIRKPDSFHEFFHTQKGRGLQPLELRVAIVAQKTAAGTLAVATPTQVFDAADAEAKCGRGSEAHLMCAKAFEQARLQGVQPEIWLSLIAENGAATAAVQTITTTVTTATAGDIVLRIAGRTLNVGVSAGDAQNTIAAAIKAKIDEFLTQLPLTASVATNVVTCTQVLKGVNGNDCTFEVVSVPSGVTVATTQTVAGAGIVDVTASMDALIDRDYNAIVVANHLAADVADAVAHTTAMWAYGEKKYRFVFIGERGSVATANALATGGNDKTVLIVSCEACPNLSCEIATAAAVYAFGKEKPNANYNGGELALYPPPAASAYSNAEIESLLSSGVTPLLPTDERDNCKIVRMVTTKTTEASAAFDALRDLAMPRTAAYLAKQVDIAYSTKFFQQTIDGDGELLNRVRDAVIEIHLAMEALGYIRDVDTFLDQIIVEEAVAPAGRLLVSDPFRVAGPLHQAVFLHTHYL